MIIDPQTMRSESHRPFTVIGATAKMVEESKVGEAVFISEARDCFGEKIPLEKFRMFICKVARAKDIKYSTRVKKDGSVMYMRLS